MTSRMDKYIEDNEQVEERVKRNKELYNTVYGKTSRFEDLPIPDNTNEIDLDSLKNMTLSRKEYQEKKNSSSLKSTPITREEEASLLEKTGSYDINEMLKKVKDDKYPSHDKKITNTNYKYLKVLDINKNEPSFVEPVKQEDMSLKHTTTLSLDILSDLKPTNNTQVTDPIQPEESKNELSTSDCLLEQMTAKMKLIKNIETSSGNVKEEEKDFYSNSYTFQKEDFDSEFADDLKPSKASIFWKSILVVVTLVVITGVVIYVLDYLEIIHLLPKK